MTFLANQLLDRAPGGLDLAVALKRMVAFRHIAVHDYKARLLPILVSVITGHLDEFLDFTQVVLKRT